MTHVLLRTIRDDPVGAMHADGDIDDAQFMAARSFQALNLKFERGLDSGVPTGDLEDELQHIEKFLGNPGMYLLHDVVVDGNALSEVWSNYDKDYDIARWMLDDSLCKLADHYNKKLKPTPTPRPRATTSPQP